MSNKLFAALALASLTLAACQHDALAPNKITGGPTLAATSGGVETNLSIPLTGFLVFVPCANGGAGETISLDGLLHVIFNVTIDDQGGVHVKDHFQPQGLSGTGLITGDKYQGTGVTQSETNTKVGSTSSFVNNFRMIGVGPGNNFMVHENAILTVNANGDVTATHDNFNVTCQ